MNYTLHQLQVFTKVVEHRSITKAAEVLHLTQPAVSIQLKNLQAQFDIPLVEVINRRLYVTDFGLEIAASAERILAEVNAINYKTYAHKGRLTGKLKVSVVSTGKYVMPYFLADFINQNEGIELQLDVTNKSKVVLNLEQNEVDFALVSVLPQHIQLGYIELMSNKLYLVGQALPQGTPPFGREIFERLPLIYREKGSGTRYTMEQYFDNQNIRISPKLELTSNEAVKQAVMAGLGYSIVPLIGIRNELQSGFLQIIPVQDFPITSTWHLVWPRQKRFSPVAHAYFDYLRNQKSTIIQEKFGWITAPSDYPPTV